MVRATTTPAGIARRARCVLLLADGRSYSAVCAALDVTDRFVARWKRRFVEGGVLALADAPRAGRQDHRLTPEHEARILHLTQHERPPAPLTHWTSRRLAARVGVSNTTVLQIWRRAGLQPHRLDRYLTSPDPEFETKAAEVIGLYLKPPEHAVVLCIDEKTAIQALDRLDPVLPLSPGRAERQWLRVLPPRHRFAVRRVGGGDWTRERHAGRAAHQCGFPALHGSRGRELSAVAGVARHSR